MLIDRPYFYGEHLRWNLWWHSPNEAAVFIVYAIILLFTISLAITVRKRSLIHWVILATALAAEVGLWFSLCKTYSRGGMIALTIGLIVVSFLFLLRRGEEKQRQIKVVILAQLAFRFVLLFGFLIITEFIGRVSPVYIQADDSVGNRLVLWQQGIAMSVLEPFGGWSNQEPTKVYSNWFQPTNYDETYRNFVNGWLDAAIQFGLPGLFFSWFILFWMGIHSLRNANEDSDILFVFKTMFIGVMVVFLMGNCFSSFIHLPSLWGPATVSGFFLFLISVKECRRSRKAFVSVFLAGILSLLMLAAWFGLGAWTLSGNPVEVIRFNEVDGVKAESRQSGESNGRIDLLVMSDPRVVGWDYGKSVREMLLRSQYPVLAICPPIAWPEEDLVNWMSKNQNSKVLLMGSQYKKLLISEDSLSFGSILVHPIGLEFPDPEKVRILVLPGVYQNPTFYRWEIWAKEHQIPIIFSEQCGVDIRYAWNSVVDKIKWEDF